MLGLLSLIENVPKLGPGILMPGRWQGKTRPLATNSHWKNKKQKEFYAHFGDSNPRYGLHFISLSAALLHVRRGRIQKMQQSPHQAIRVFFLGSWI